MIEQFVFIVDDDPVVGESVGKLAASMGIKARPHASAEDFLACYERTQPGCLVSPIQLRGMSGLELLSVLRSGGHGMPIVFLTKFADVPLVVQAMQAGAVTVLQKPYHDQGLWDAIRKALAADAEARVQEARLTQVSSQLATLTNDEKRVLALIEIGTTNKGISQQLSLGLRTVEARRHSLMVKLKVDSLAELVRLVTETRLLGHLGSNGSPLNGADGSHSESSAQDRSWTYQRASTPTFTP